MSENNNLKQFMKTIIIILLGAGLVGAAEAVKPPATTPPPAPVFVVLTELQQTKVDLVIARLQLNKQAEAVLNAEADKYLTEACVSAGGKVLADCNVVGPTQAQPRYTVGLKPPIVAKVAVLKK